MEMKRKVLQALIKQMHGMMSEGEGEEALKKPALEEALEEAKEEALESPEEALEVVEEDEEALPVAVKKKPMVTISMSAIKRSCAPKPVMKASRPVMQVPRKK